MNHAFGEEVVEVVFTNGRSKGKGKWEDRDESPSLGQGKERRRTDLMPTPI
jgi:hypothetical protein